MNNDISNTVLRVQTIREIETDRRSVRQKRQGRAHEAKPKNLLRTRSERAAGRTSVDSDIRPDRQQPAKEVDRGLCETELGWADIICSCGAEIAEAVATTRHDIYMPHWFAHCWKLDSAMLWEMRSLQNKRGHVRHGLASRVKAEHVMRPYAAIPFKIKVVRVFLSSGSRCTMA